MKKSIFMDKKLLIPAILVTGLIAAYVVATPVLAVIGHKMIGNSTMPKITGSVNVGDAIKNFTNDNQKVSFSAASATAEKQVINGKVLGGHIGIAQGYLVYTFIVVNPENQTGYKVIVDPGNGQVTLYFPGQYAWNIWSWRTRDVWSRRSEVDETRFQLVRRIRG